MPKTRIKKKTNTTGGFQDLGYTLTEDEITSFNNKVDKVTSTDNAIARFDGTTGAIQNSTVKITDAGKIIAPSFASDATEAGMVFSDNNELNFGSNSNTLYIGYRNKLNTSGSIGIYNFGTSSGSTGMQKGRINAGDIYSNGTKVVVESALEGLATETFVTEKIAELVNAAPPELDTLKELADEITNNKTIIESVNAAIGNKAPNNHASTATTYGVATTSKYGHVKINNGDVNTVASSNGVAAGMDHSHSNYVQTSRKINGNTLDDDITLTASDVGAEPAFTKNTAFNKNFGTTSGTVCQGNDSRLSNARTPTAHTHTKSEITDFPTVNNGTLTIQKNGTNVQTFTANQSTNVIANITVPTKTSELTNDSGFITSDDLSSSVTSVVGQTGDVTADQIKSGMQTSDGGFSIGDGSRNVTTGGAIGAGANCTTGGSVGNNSQSTTGGAVGRFSQSTTGGAVGEFAMAITGFAGGNEAQASDGFAGGYKAKATAAGAVQLGEGRNATANTLQFRGYQLLNASGKIPSERLNITIPTKTSDLTNDSGFITSAPVTSVVGQIGDVTASQLVSAILTGNINFGDKIVDRSQFLSAYGYIKFESGLIIQWGNIIAQSSEFVNGVYRVNFYTPFKSDSAYSVQTTIKNNTAGRGYVGVNTKTTTYFTVGDFYYGSVEKSMNWIAIGY